MKKNSKPVSNDNKLKALEMLKNGISQAEVARVFGVTKAAVSIWAKNNNIPSRNKKPSTIVKAINLIKQGKSKTEVAKIIKTYYHNIHHWCKKTNTPYVKKPQYHQFYSDEFKTNAMNLLREGKSKLSVSKLLGINYKTLSKWQNKGY